MNETNTLFRQASERLEQIGQKDLIAHWHALNTAQKETFAAQLVTIDLETLKQQKALVKETPTHAGQITPFAGAANSGNAADAATGRKAIAEGKVGCLIVAGGQGTRLGFNGPKGLYGITPILRKSLFQLFAEKTLAASTQAGRTLPLAIMTSSDNDVETRLFFEHHRWFGLDPNMLSFFTQNELPLLNDEGNLFLESTGTLAIGPDGNGGALQAFFRSGLFDKWDDQGVRYLNFVLIDNPLADPFDAELIGYQINHPCDVLVKCTLRSSPEEKVGLLARVDNKPAVVEYSELSDTMRRATDLFPLANLSLFSFSMDFIRKVAQENVSMPLHRAFKAAKYMNENGQTVKADKPIAWKFERFIFDLLPKARSVQALVYPREECFAPLKNGEGPDSPAAVAAALETRDRQTLEKITGVPCDTSPLEISPQFYYPTEDLLKKWKGKRVSSGYIEA